MNSKYLLRYCPN